jgi:membrane-associated phospholipid phosphatase
VYRLSTALLVCAFAALAALVSTGRFTRIDQWSVDHLMPGAKAGNKGGDVLDGLVPLLHANWNSPYAIANIVTLPAAFLVSLAIAFACSRTLGAMLLAAVAVEVLCKELLARPALYDRSFHIASFDSSFPSGHALRTVIVAAAIARTWPRARSLVVAWSIASIVLLQLAGWHTATDIAGGVLLGALALLGARAAGALGGRRLAARARARSG